VASETKNAAAIRIHTFFLLLHIPEWFFSKAKHHHCHFAGGQTKAEQCKVTCQELISSWVRSEIKDSLPDPSTAMEEEYRESYKSSSGLAVGGICVTYDFTLSSNTISQCSYPEHFSLILENTRYRAEQILDLIQLLLGRTKAKGHLLDVSRNMKDSS